MSRIVIFVLGFCFGWLAVREHEKTRKIKDFISILVLISMMPMPREIDEWAIDFGYMNMLRDARAAGVEASNTVFGMTCFLESVERHNMRANEND